MNNKKCRLEKDDISFLENLIKCYHVGNPDQAGLFVNMLLKQSQKTYTLDEVAYMYVHAEKLIRRKKNENYGKYETIDQ